MTLAGIVQRWRRWQLARDGLRLDRSCFVDRMVSLGPRPADSPPGAVSAGAECEFSLGVELNAWDGHIRVGRRVFFGPYVVVYGQGGVEIGDDTLIAMHSCILSSDHAVPPRKRKIRDEPNLLRPTRIGCDVWLGARVVVLGGVTIGDGCVVGAGSVVAEDLPHYSVSVGVPATIVRYRE